jgi:hypothetical protein
MKHPWLLLLVLFTIPAYGDLPEGQWRSARPIILPKMPTPGLVYLPLDEEALAGVQSLSEYRIVRAGRAEVPYRMEVEDGHTRSQELPAKITSQAVAKDAKGVSTRLEIAFDLGSQAGLVNQVALRLRGDNFRCRVFIDGARAADQPGLRLGEGLVYRHEGRFEQTRVAIPPNEFHFLRLTAQAIQGKLPVLEGATVLSELKVPPYRLPVPAKLLQREDPKERATILDLDFGMLIRDLDLAKFQIEEPTFDRSVSIEVTDLRTVPVPPEDREIGVTPFRQEGVIYTKGGMLRRDVAAKPVVLPLGIESARKLRIIISNGDDRPLTIRQVSFFRLRRGLVFNVAPAFEHELWYGRPDAPEPDYDIARLPLTTPPAGLPIAQLGKARSLPVKPPALPWSEKHRALFWIILAAVLILLAALILRAMRNVKAPPQGEAR